MNCAINFYLLSADGGAGGGTRLWLLSFSLLSSSHIFFLNTVIGPTTLNELPPEQNNDGFTFGMHPTIKSHDTPQ